MKYLVCGGIVIYMVTVAYCLQCHDCQTMADTECSDPLTVDTFLSDCDDDQYCVKYKTIVKIRDSGYINGWERPSVVVTRTCEAREGKSEGCVGWQNNGGFTLKCWCGSDGCNSGFTLAPKLTLVVGCLFTLLFFAHWSHCLL